MPAARRKQSNAMLYTLIVFVGLFIVATTAAVFYYVKAEDYRITGNEYLTKLETYATTDEQDDVGSIVGAANPMTSYLGTMVERFDKAITLIIGGTPASTSAEVKISNASAQAEEMRKLSEQYEIGTLDPNYTGLVQVVKLLSQKLQNALDANAQVQKTLDTTIADFKKKQEVSDAELQELRLYKEKLRQDYNDVRQKYDDLAKLQKESTDEQVQYYKEQLDQETSKVKAMEAELQKIQAKYDESQGMLAKVKEQLASFGEPQRDPMAYIPDGKVVSVDNESKVVYINLGSNDHVYLGLTFAVYDKGSYIGQEGQDKAEIEIFNISDTYSAARIIKSELSRPILAGDLAANLIWDSRKKNQFVIAGDFDLNDDGNTDYDAAAKIKTLIDKWGGTVSDNISIDTDYLILGKQPQILEKPSMEDQEADPTAMQRYESALEKYSRYNDLVEKAGSLWIPVFTYEKFIHLIGYAEKVGQAGSF